MSVEPEEEESEQPVSPSSSIMAPIGLKAVVGESKRALLILIRCVLIRFKDDCMIRGDARDGGIGFAGGGGGGGGGVCARCFFPLLLSGCGCEAAASGLRMKMKAVLRPLYPMARLGLHRGWRCWATGELSLCGGPLCDCCRCAFVTQP